jgi:Rps23 Pro-64 3,4-dihydroxylase Tpa1-like proline 4-hydroxylase
MKEELLNNGFVSFSINDSMLDSISCEFENNKIFDRLKISFDGVGNSQQTGFNGFQSNEIKKNELKNKNNLSQIWHWCKDNNNLTNELLYKIFSQFYNHKKDELNIMSSITLFTEGCFIENHLDGMSSDRIAGILIYLNKNYDENNGGCLILKNKTKIIPEYGNVVVIDYTKNSVEHLVTKVIKNDRKAICAFIHKKI